MQPIKIQKSIGLKRAPKREPYFKYLVKNFLDGRVYIYTEMAVDKYSKDINESTIKIRKIKFENKNDINKFLDKYYDLDTKIVPSPGDIIQ